jgi:hypothetical protein
VPLGVSDVTGCPIHRQRSLRPSSHQLRPVSGLFGIAPPTADYVCSWPRPIRLDSRAVAGHSRPPLRVSLGVRFHVGGADFVGYEHLFDEAGRVVYVGEAASQCRARRSIRPNTDSFKYWSGTVWDGSRRGARSSGASSVTASGVEVSPHRPQAGLGLASVSLSATRPYQVEDQADANLGAWVESGTGARPRLTRRPGRRCSGWQSVRRRRPAAVSGDIL